MAQAGQEEASRAAVMSSFFYFAANLLNGADGMGKTDTTPYNRTDGMMGPQQESAGLILGADGRWYSRGAVAQGNSKANDGAPAAATVAGVTITPGLLMLALAALFILRK